MLKYRKKKQCRFNFPRELVPESEITDENEIKIKRSNLFFTNRDNEVLFINQINDSNFLITFSYGRGLQASALKEFGKDQENTENIQKAFNHRAKMNGLSSKGEWSEELEKEFEKAMDVD